MRLDIYVVRAEKRASQVGRLRLDCVDIVTAGVKPVARITLGVLVGEKVSLRQLHRQRAVVLARDQLDVGSLVGQFFDDRLDDTRRDGTDRVQAGVEGSRSRLDAVRGDDGQGYPFEGAATAIP